MKLRIAIPLTAALLVGALPWAPSASAATPVPAKRATAAPLAAKLKQCVASDVLGHVAVFTASMPALAIAGKAPAARMAMRFELQQGGGERVWLPVLGVPSFGTWELSEAGRPGYIVTKRVTGLQVGGAYRAVVRYRWLNAKGRVLRTAKRITASCRQPDTRADLVPKDPAIVTGTRKDLVVYKIAVRNKGKGRAIASAVTVEVNGTVQPAQHIDPLARGERKVVTFQAPRCTTGSIVRFTVDASNEVTEIDERDNVLELRCVARTAGGAPA